MTNNHAKEMNTTTHADTTDVVRLTLRLPTELAETLRTYVFLTRESGNSVVNEALRRYLATEGRDKLVAASTTDTVARYSTVLDKLGDS